MSEHVEIRDGIEYRVVVLPEAKPPKGRSRKTRFHFEDVGKRGDVPARKRRKKST